MTGRLRVGCSGWMYDDWRGRVYPADMPKTGWLGAYAERFDAVEVDSTFYRLPSVATVERWARGVPRGFRFAVKVGSYGTHRRKLREPETWLGHHVDVVRALGRRLGPNLVQLPPRWHRDVGRLDAFLAAAPADLRWAVEVRDPSWLHDDVYAVLERHGAALCVHDLLPRHPWRRTAGWAFVRFHGPRARQRPYRGRYGEPRLDRFAERLAAWLDEGTDTWVFFNNDVRAASVADAAWLRDRLRGSRRPSAPGG